MQFRFLHSADIHLDSPLKGLESFPDAPVAEIRGATRRAFDNLIDLAIDEKIDFLLLAGDLYDGEWKDYNTGIFFAGRMGKLKKAGIKVFIVSGNHDAASQITKAMPLPDNVILFPHHKPASVILDDLDVIIHGQSYSSRAVTDNLVSQYPQHDSNHFNIGLLHTSLTGRQGHENYAPCTLDDLKSKGYDYWALGHVHQREIVSKDPLIVFPGNIQGRHIKETGAKGATMVTVEDGSIIEVLERELDVLRWVNCQIDISACETNESVHEQVRGAMKQVQEKAPGMTLALRLQLDGNCSLHADLHGRSAQWTEEFRAIAESLGNLWLEKVKFRTKRKVGLEEIVGEATPFAGLLQAVNGLDFGDETLTSLLPDLAVLKAKLPAELLGANSVLENSSEELTEMKEEVKELLIAKLIQHETQS